MWGQKSARLEKPRSNQLILLQQETQQEMNLFTHPQIKRSIKLQPCPFLLFVFSIQISGFSMANSSQLVAGSTPDSRLTLLTVSECHKAITYPTTDVSMFSMTYIRPFKISPLSTSPFLTLFMHPHSVYTVPILLCDS